MMWFRKLFVPLLLLSLFCSSTCAVKKPYVVYLGSRTRDSRLFTSDLNGVTQTHHQILASVLGSGEKAKEAFSHSCKHHIDAFVATLEEDEAAEIAKRSDVVSVFLNGQKRLHTTHSWEFMMLERNGVVPHSSLWKNARFGEDTIIGNLDTGVWPEAKSFDDEGYGPIPIRWKGSCQNNTATGVPCNRKLIGAKFFDDGYASYMGAPSNTSFRSARDSDGHGSHTLSTAGGNFVSGANVFGIGNGTAKGGSPKARVASYKVCWPADSGGCFNSDIMSGFDMAIEDGVDVLSVSLGGDSQGYFDDPVAIGAFHAVKNGITVVASAGNSGPTPATVSNGAPWIFTIGASTLDREFEASVKLDNGQTFQGESLSVALPESKNYPLITGAQATAANASAEAAMLCLPGQLDPAKAKGKIVVCLRGVSARVDKGKQALLAGAVGMILCNDEASGNEIISDAHVLPATQIGFADGIQVFSYVNSTKNPLGYITPPTARLNAKPAPFMAAFSSRGPNTITSEILKPDVTAPGVNIIAAYTEATGPSEDPSDKRRTPFNTESGTSMSCPHVSGIVGLLRTMYPEWSPAAIRSAIMTTARTRDNTMKPMTDGASGQEATPLDHGSGHVRPNRAMDPGLIYDLTTTDYLNFLCAIGYNQTMIQQIAGSAHNCPHKARLHDFNYPSMTVRTSSFKHLGHVTLRRKLKNVGPPGTYAARIRSPYGVKVSVKPKILKFEKVGEEKTFKMVIKPEWKDTHSEHVFGGLTWTDGKHYVRSPITVLAQ